MGIFSLKLIENLRFYPQIQSEDALFGMLLFSHSKAIAILTEPLHICRARANSTSEQPSNTTHRSSLFRTISRISFSLFWITITPSIIMPFPIRIFVLDTYRELLPTKFSPTLKTHRISTNPCQICLWGSMLSARSRYVREILKPYMQKVPFHTKITYHTPRIFKAIHIRLAQTLKR